MLWSTRRAILVLSLVAGLAVTTSMPLALVAEPASPTPPGTTREFTDNINLPTDPDLERKDPIVAALDYIAAARTAEDPQKKKEYWDIATTHLQALLDRREDVFVAVACKGTDGKETKARLSVKAEANRLIASMPAEGLDFYKVRYGELSGAMLRQARENNNIEQLSTLMARYLYTDAGGEATKLLGTYYLDRGNYVSAGLCFKRLFHRDALAKLSPLTLFKSAYAFHMAGDKENEARAWQEMNRRGQHVTLGTERRSVEELQTAVAALERDPFERNLNDWAMYGGTPSRNGKGAGDTPFLDARWRRPTFEQTTTKTWIDQAATFVRDRKLPFLPAMFPITATVTKDGRRLPLLLYRSHWGIFAVNVKTGDLAWKAPSHWSLDMMVSNPRKQTDINTWVNYYLQTLQKPTLLFENSTVGTLSTDNTFLFAIEDLAVSPPPTMGAEFDPRFGQGGAGFPREQIVRDAVQHNKLQAYDLVTGKLKWELGGRGEKHGELADSYFLGPPLPIAGKLYALSEKGQSQDLHWSASNALTGKVLYMQTLASTKDKMQQDALRRMQAAHLAYGEGMLVCPTNSGALLGVDQLTKSVVWAYPYRQKTAQASQPEDPINMGRFGRHFRPRLGDGTRWPLDAARGHSVQLASVGADHPGRPGGLHRPGRPLGPLHQPARRQASLGPPPQRERPVPGRRLQRQGPDRRQAQGAGPEPGQWHSALGARGRPALRTGRGQR